MKRQGEVDIAAMSVATAEKRTGLALRLLEDREAQRARVSKSEARARLSRRSQIACGTIFNLVQGRVKDLKLRVYRAVQNELQREKARLDHELFILRQIGTDPRSDEIAHIMAVDALIDREGA